MNESVTGKGKAWEFARFWWLAALCIILIGWISFVYMGVKTKTRKWIIEGVVYCIALHISFFFTSLAVIYPIFWIGSIVRIFLFRKEYLLKRAAIDNVVNRYKQRINEDLANAVGENNTSTLSVGQSLERSSRNVAETNNMVQDVQIFEEVADREGNDVSGLNSHIIQGKDDQQIIEEIVDINSCEEKDLEKLPGISVAMAKKALAHRNDVGGYNNLDEFYTFLGLKPHIVSQICERIKCGDKPQITRQSGRILDI